MANTGGLHDSCSHHIANLITFADAIMAIITAATTTRPQNRNYLMDNRFFFAFTACNEIESQHINCINSQLT